MLDKGIVATRDAFAGSGATAAVTTSQVPDATGVSPNAKSIRDYLQAGGLTKVAASGVVGNLQQESSLDAAAPGGGLAQWIGSRWDQVVSFATGKGLDPSSEQAQLEYLLQDLQTNFPVTLSQLNSASTPAEAATIFQNQYERPSVPMQQNRIDYANAAYAL